MKAHSIKTDNANIGKKISLRKQATAHLDNLRVLDLFAGNNVLWSHFDCTRYYGIEKEKNKGRNLTADNLRIIANLDLSGFNVIDADSYGIPFNQIVAIFENSTLTNNTVVIYTLITNKMSMLNKQCLKKFNIERLYKKCKVLMNGKAQELFESMLYENGVRKLFYYTDSVKFYKEYGYFIVDKQSIL